MHCPAFRLAVSLLSIAVAAAVAVTPATAQQRLVTVTTPSAHVDPGRVSFNGDDHPRDLRANVLLPDG